MDSFADKEVSKSSHDTVVLPVFLLSPDPADFDELVPDPADFDELAPDPADFDELAPDPEYDILEPE